MWLNITEGSVRHILEVLRRSEGRDSAQAAQEIDEFLPENRGKDLGKYRAAAERKQRDGEIEIDSDAVVSKGDDSGAYVMAWMWICDGELE